jgi:hypothetical protein
MNHELERGDCLCEPVQDGFSCFGQPEKMRLTYGYAVISIVQTMPILVVASEDASTDRGASRKSPLIGAFFCLKIGKESGDHYSTRHEGY